jgi:hypothetical protein
MNAADFDKLADAEKEHFFWCSKCRQFVDKRELRDVNLSRDRPQAEA